MITDDEIMGAIRTALLAIVGVGWEVFQAQGNRVPEPAGDNFIVMTPLRRIRLSTNRDTWDTASANATAINHEYSTGYEVQLDIYGDVPDTVQAITTLWRDEYATDLLDGTGVTPLYANDGHQTFFKNAEEQYENRWIMEIAAQVNPIVSTSAQFAASLSATIVPVGG